MNVAGADLPDTPQAEFRRGWRPLLACCVGLGLGLSPIPAYTSGIFAIALMKEFGWSRGEILSSIFCVTIALILLGPLVGRAADRFGARRVAIVSTAGLGVSISLLGFITSEIWTFYLGWSVVAVVSLGTLPITYARIIATWFNKARGLALGVALASSGTAGIFAPAYVQFLITHFGWRLAYVGIGAIPICIVLPVLYFFLEDRPHAASRATDTAEPGVSVRAALRDRRFWIIGGAGALAGIGVGIVPNLAPLLADKGFSPGAAAQLMSILGLSIITGRVLVGFLLDRIWAPIVACGIFLLPALAMLILSGDGTGWATSGVAIALIGLAVGAEFDIVAYLTSRFFGRRHFAEIYAIQFAVCGIGTGSGPAIFGYMRDTTGSYRSIEIVAAGLFLLAAGLLLTLGRYPRRFDSTADNLSSQAPELPPSRIAPAD